MATDVPDAVCLVRELAGANVQFVLVGEPDGGRPISIVLSRHPTNLEAVGRALDRLDSTVRAQAIAAAGGDAHSFDPVRVGDPLGTIPVTTSAGDVDLIFGGPRRSLYAQVAAQAREREVGGLRVQWTEALPHSEPAGRTTGRLLGRRLLSLAEGLAHLVERQDERGDGEPGTGA